MKNLFLSVTGFNIFNALKFAMFIIAIQAINSTVMAQITSEIAVNSTESNFSSDLNKIKQEKLVIEAKSKEQEAACYKKFGVSSCLKDVKTEKLAALNEVKRRELEINNQLRSQKEKALQEKQEKRESSKATIKSKESPEALKSGNSEKKSRESKTRAEKLPTDDKQRVDAASKRAADANQKLAANQKKAQLRANKQSQSSAQAAGYTKKLQLAEAHKNEIAQKQAAKTKPKSAPLPIPSAAEIAR
jgi:colicin import membrane protein